jgi:hypothetical protein
MIELRSVAESYSLPALSPWALISKADSTMLLLDILMTVAFSYVLSKNFHRNPHFCLVNTVVGQVAGGVCHAVR